jgi:hypothetical protein
MNDGRGTFKSGSPIDLFIASSEIANISKWDLYGLFSDHHTMILTVGLEKVPPSPRPVHFNFSSAEKYGSRRTVSGKHTWEL